MMTVHLPKQWPMCDYCQTRQCYTLLFCLYRPFRKYPNGYRHFRVILLQLKTLTLGGRNRNPNNWSYTSVPAVPDWLYRGYTGHEGLGQFSLINMNGRIYDPIIGRMISPDINITYPRSTEGCNRHGYGLNNPLIYIDPTGNSF